MRTHRRTLVRVAVLLAVVAGLACSSCGSSANMYKHKRNTDCGC